ncbi:hypothetical protein KUCAC02_011831, partial [Chaenocephalus aceratus]
PNNKYIPVTVQMTSSSAQRYCREKYTDLTSMRTQQEKEDILKVTDESSWWIGVYRKLWNWPDRSISSLALWTTGDPNGGASELCVVGYLGGWAELAVDVRMNSCVWRLEHSYDYSLQPPVLPPGGETEMERD